MLAGHSGGNYEVIKNLCKADLMPFATSWVETAISNGLGFVVIDSLTGRVAYAHVNEVVGYEENAPSGLKLTRNGQLRQTLRREFERNDPFWRKVMKQNEQRKLAYGSVMAAVGGKNADLTGPHSSSITLGLQYSGLWIVAMSSTGVLDCFVSDVTHWKTIEMSTRALKINVEQFGDRYYLKSSEFDVNAYIEGLDDGDKKNFVYDPNVERKMVCDKYLHNFWR